VQLVQQTLTQWASLPLLELRDFVNEDLSKWYPAVSGRVKLSLVEALPNILPSFSQKMVEFTKNVFKANEIEILTKHVVKDVDAKSVSIQNASGEIVTIPMGMLIWAAGNTARPLTRDLQGQYKDIQTNRRGIEVNPHLRMKGDDSIFVLGDAAATDLPPSAQVASQQGKYLADIFNQLNRIDTLQEKLKEVKSKNDNSDEARLEISRVEKKLRRAEYSLKPFLYTNKGKMSYVGSNSAIIELPFSNTEFSAGGTLAGLAVSDPSRRGKASD
jgi:NADH:ubiquinone reductase (non-electrogenic)